MAKLLYGGGLRLMACLRLRVGDVDFEKEKLYIRDGKGGKDRVTVSPKSIHDELGATPSGAVAQRIYWHRV